LAHQIQDSRGEGAANFRAGNVFEPDLFTQVLKEDPADKVARYVLALEKDRVSSNIEKLPEVPRA
jgi:hypothetical protein